MRVSTLAVALLWPSLCQAAVTHIPLKANLALQPNDTYVLTLDTTEPVEIGWQAIQAKPCATNCVEMTDLNRAIRYSLATRLGASQKYTPVSGKVSIEFKNLSSEPVTINVYRVQRICDAEACKYVDVQQKARWLVFLVDEFRSITTSADGSYSVISGVVVSGRPFTFRAVWWTDEKGVGVNCSAFVTRYLDTHTPKENYRPYVIAGQAVGDGANIVLRSIDSCAPKATHFGAPEGSIYK